MGLEPDCHGLGCEQEEGRISKSSKKFCHEGKRKLLKGVTVGVFHFC